MTKEERILKMVKRVLTDIAKDTHTQPGVKHPLSEHTVQGIRECLSLITARESELAAETGRELKDRPHFVDEPRTTHAVSITSIKRKKEPADKDDQ